jgi:DNA polymerase I-like protein with 3'-5' exonuclease and polymerase domains
LFQFGGNVSTRAKHISITKYDSLLRDSWKPNEKYFLFLTEFILPKYNLDWLIKDIEAAGIQSYCIVSSVSVKQIEDDSTETLLTLESNWRDFLVMNDKKVDAIVAFGSAIRVLNKSGDVNWYDFIADTFFEPRYWCGKEFVNGPDCWVYTSAGSDYLYPVKCKSNPVNWTTRFFRNQLKRIQKDDLSGDSLDMRDYEIIFPQSKDETTIALKTLVNSTLLSVDIETAGFNFLRDRLGYIQLSNDGEKAYFLEWKNVDKRILNLVLKTAKRTTFANGKFDTKFLWKNGITKEFYQTDDITALSHAMNSDRPKGLKPATIFWCGKFTGYDLELDRLRKKLNIKNYLDFPVDIMKKYAGIDAIVTWRIQKALDKKVKKIDVKFPNEKIPEWTIEKWYKDIMMPNIRMVTDVEYEGVYFDKEQFAISGQAIKEKIAELKKELAETWNVSEKFLFESPKELGILFKKMGWPMIEESKAGDFKTSDFVLTEYEAQGKPGIKTLKDLRSYNVGLGTFIEGWGNLLELHEDGSYRIHPNCNCFGVVSFRHSMTNPNFQQMPSSSIMSSYIKKLFTVPDNDKENWLLASADFSSLQMRMGMADEGLNKNGIDPVSIEVYGSNGHQDSHSSTGFSVFCESVHQEIIDIEDENGKIISFLPQQKIKIKRKNLSGEIKEKIINGEMFVETDEFVNYA